MPRVRPQARLRRLAPVAAEVFIRSGGFARAQIGDVARELGVAKGTLYLYVAGKEALFDWALRYADAATPPADPPLPIPTPPPGALVETLRRRLETEGQLESLAAAPATPPDDAVAELATILGELYDLLATSRRTIKLLTVAAPELPELAEVWFRGGRGRLVRRLAGHLESRAAAGALACPAPPLAAARTLLEAVSWAAVHRHWDPDPDPLKDDEVRDAAVALARSFRP